MMKNAASKDAAFYQVIQVKFCRDSFVAGADSV